MNIKRGEVLILKAQADDDSINYTKSLESVDFLPKIIPVLDFEYCNLSTLKTHLDTPLHYSGIVFTSPRSVHAVCESLGLESLSPEWRNLSTFVVGDATKKLVLDRLGLVGERGVIENAAGLADLIVKRSYEHPLLFPCSDMRRETLPTMLSAQGISLVEVIVYRTKQHPQLRETLTSETAQGTAFPEFIVFFSPSGVKYAYPLLVELNAPLHDIKVVTIGNTTESAVKEANIPIWSCAGSPSPSGLLQALTKTTVT